MLSCQPGKCCEKDDTERNELSCQPWECCETRVYLVNARLHTKTSEKGEQVLKI